MPGRRSWTMRIVLAAGAVIGFIFGPRMRRWAGLP
jgi:hypothetical protein